MTSTELKEARERLELSHVDLAAEFGLSPDVIEAMEMGRAPVPKKMARKLRWQMALREQQETLSASGLPECPLAVELVRRVAGLQGEALVCGLEELQAHATSCAACQAREDYARAHAPAVPEYPLPLWVRAFGRVAKAIENLPPGLRPPEGEAGEGRRTGIMMAAVFSAFAMVVMGAGVLVMLATQGGLDGEGRGMALGLILIPTGYFLGFYMGGLAFDVTRPVRHRLIGYMIRGGLGAAAVYGAVGLVMPFFDDEITFADVPVVTGILAVLGCLFGAGLWVKHRLQGRFAPPA